VQRLYLERHPDWRVVEAPASDGPWCKGAALAPVIEDCDAAIVVQADADVWTDGLGKAVSAVEDGAPWAIPHLLVHRLSEDGTAAMLAGKAWKDQPLDQRPYRGIQGGGIVVATSDVMRAVPVDSRFTAWGQEDECHAAALNALVGPPWRGDAVLWHCWHPPQPRMTRRRGSRESWELRKCYMQARKDPCAMSALIEESRVVSPTAQHPRDDHPAVAR